MYKSYLNTCNTQENPLLFSKCWLTDVYSVSYYDSQSNVWKTCKYSRENSL